MKMGENSVYRILKTEDNIIEPDVSCIKELIEKDYHTKDEWKEVTLKWYDGINKPMCDFIFIYGFILVCNEKTYSILQRLDSIKSNLFLPINVESQRYYIIKILSKEENVLNRRKSKIEYFSDKTIMSIREYVFKPFHPQSCLFKIEESCTSLFATDEFVYCVKSNDLTGMEFEECKMKKGLFSF